MPDFGKISERFPGNAGLRKDFGKISWKCRISERFGGGRICTAVVPWTAQRKAQESLAEPRRAQGKLGGA